MFFCEPHFVDAIFWTRLQGLPKLNYTLCNEGLFILFFSKQVLDFLVCFPAFLLFCFSAFLLFCCSASLPFCCFASLLLCFSAFCFSCFSACLLLCFSASLLFCFSASLLFCCLLFQFFFAFTASLLFMRFSALPSSFLLQKNSCSKTHTVRQRWFKSISCLPVYFRPIVIVTLLADLVKYRLSAIVSPLSHGDPKRPYSRHSSVRSAAWAPLVARWRRGSLRGRRGTWRHQAWRFTTSTLVLRGRRGTSRHPPSFCVAGRPSFRVAGVALGVGFGHIDHRFVWHVWQCLTETVAKHSGMFTETFGAGHV